MLYLFVKKNFVSSVKKEDNCSFSYTLKELVDTKDSINLPRKHMSLVSDAANDNFIFPMNIIYHLFPYLTNSSKIYKNALVWSKQCARQSPVGSLNLTPQQCPCLL